MSGAPLFNLTGVRPRLYESVLKMNGTGSTPTKRPGNPRKHAWPPAQTGMEISTAANGDARRAQRHAATFIGIEVWPGYLPGPGALQPCNPDVTRQAHPKENRS